MPDLPASSPIPEQSKHLRQQAAELQAQVACLQKALAAAQAALAAQPGPGSVAATGQGLRQQGKDIDQPCPDAVGLDSGPQDVALRRRQERLHAIIESAVDYAIITTDFEGRITGWNSGAVRLLGWDEPTALGRPLRLIFTPEDCAVGLPETEMRQALAVGKAIDERWHIRRDGTRFWASGEIMPLHDSEPLGFLKILRDCTDQRQAGEALRESEQLYRLIVESARDYAIFTTDLLGRITSWNPGARNVLKWEESEAIGRPNSILYTPEDHLAGVPEAEMAQALAEGNSEHDRWHLRADGQRIWGTEVVTPLQDGSGAAHGFLKILRDRTEQKRQEEQRQLLLAELNHRVKNTLAIVQSMAFQTARTAASTPAAMSDALEARLDALASAYSLLTQETWAGAELTDVVRTTLAPYGMEGERTRVSGPDLWLMPDSALVINMALHELATNAAKYGVLSVEDGRLEVSWSLDRPADAAGGATLDLLWRERGGPPVVPQPKRGFGSRLIENSVSYQLGGSVVLEFEPEGVECRFRIPLPSTERA